MSTLNKAQLKNQAWSLNTEKYDALFTARGFLCLDLNCDVSE